MTSALAPEAVRFHSLRFASLCLAFSPGKGSFTVIETSLPEALYTCTHTHRKTSSGLLNFEPGWVRNVSFWVYFSVFLSLCMGFCVTACVSLCVCVYDCVSVYTILLHETSLCMCLPVYLCHYICALVCAYVLYPLAKLFCKTLHLCACAVFVRWQSEP